MGWIAELPSPYQEQAEQFAKADSEYNIKDYYELLYDNPAMALSYGFIWEDCGGFHYWDNIINEHFNLQ